MYVYIGVFSKISISVTELNKCKRRRNWPIPPDDSSPWDFNLLPPQKDCLGQFPISDPRYLTEDTFVQLIVLVKFVQLVPRQKHCHQRPAEEGCLLMVAAKQSRLG